MIDQFFSEDSPEEYDNIPPRERVEPQPPRPSQTGGPHLPQPGGPQPPLSPLHHQLWENTDPQQRPKEVPIIDRAQEEELLYANLLVRTDFDEEFIEEVLEFSPDEENWARIDELVEKANEDPMQQHLPHSVETTILL